MAGDLTHEHCSELLGDYARGALDARASELVESHLRSCRDCSAEMSSVRALIQTDDAPLTELERARLERNVAWELGDVIPARPARSRLWTRTAQALGAAALLAIVAVGIVQLGTGGGDDSDFGSASGGGGRDTSNQGSKGAAETGSSLDTAAGASAPRPRPSFDRHAGAITKENLNELGKTGSQFRHFTAYSSDDAARLQDSYVNALATQASTTEQQDQVRRCAHLAFDSTGSYSLLPAYAADARLNGREALVLGFAWTNRPTGPLDQYMLWVWPISGCNDPNEVPLDYSAGKIKPHK